MLESLKKGLKKDLDKGMPVITYIKTKFGFESVEDFESYINGLREKADKYDQIIKDDKKHN